ncbi:Uracil-DNA glycosylase superfamily [Mycolicibacterium rhodesiae JS60]|nr:Uracil-DNA glycosylase superfamily [Mycolicibacterium rhodesiae JS60]
MTNQDERERFQRKMLLDDEIRACRRCDDMNEVGVTQAAPGWGNLSSPVAIIGQSLCEQCMRREPPEPFYEKSGTLLDRAYTLAGCKKSDLFITNAVHCHPRGNRKSEFHEIVNCAPYLYRELELVRPRLVIALGDDAQRVVSFFYPTAREVPAPFVTPKNIRSKTVPCLYFTWHPSYVKRQHNDALATEWVNGTADALAWAIAKGSLRTTPESAAPEGQP